MLIDLAIPFNHMEIVYDNYIPARLLKSKTKYQCLQGSQVNHYPYEPVDIIGREQWWDFDSYITKFSVVFLAKSMTLAYEIMNWHFYIQPPLLLTPEQTFATKQTNKKTNKNEQAHVWVNVMDG